MTATAPHLREDTHSLTVGERGDFYRLRGLDPTQFDTEVIRQTNRTARRAFPVCLP